MNAISDTYLVTNKKTMSLVPRKRAFDLCVQKTLGNIKRLADEPKSAAWAVDGNYFNFKENFFEIGNWTSSFFTGMALLAWRETEDEYFLNQVLRLAPHYREKVFKRHLRPTTISASFHRCILLRSTNSPATSNIAKSACAPLKYCPNDSIPPATSSAPGDTWTPPSKPTWPSLTA